MEVNIADYVERSRPTWVKLRDLVEYLLAEHRDLEDCTFKDVCAAVQAATRRVDEVHLARCLNGFDIPDLSVQRVLFRWCQQKIATLLDVSPTAVDSTVSPVSHEN